MIGLLRQRNLPQIAFVDKELSQELDKRVKNKENKKDLFPEHEFIASCLRVGLTLSDLKELTYIDVMKIFLSYIEEGKPQTRQATQSDWDALAGRR